LHKYLFSLRFIASGLGSGWLPKAPGTWGSLAALIPAWLCLTYGHLSSLWLATLLISVLGFLVCYVLLPQLVILGEHHDPGWIVIDEWAGQWLSIAILMSLLPQANVVLILGLSFVLFRMFDILKPFPIRQLESWGPHWFSIMFDDLIAGLMAAGVGFAIMQLI